MPAITIENVPEELRRRLEERASKHHRAIDREALAVLEEVLMSEPYRIPPVEPHKTKLPLTQEWLDWAIREGRK